MTAKYCLSQWTIDQLQHGWEEHKLIQGPEENQHCYLENKSTNASLRSYVEQNPSWAHSRSMNSNKNSCRNKLPTSAGNWCLYT